MKNLIRSLTHFGASYKLTLTGAPADVQREVYGLHTYGIISNIPEDYKEGEDDSVTLSSQRKHFVRGFRTMAEVGMQRDATRHTVRQHKAGWHARVTVRAAHLAKQYIRARRADGTFETFESASNQTYRPAADFGTRDGGSEE